MENISELYRRKFERKWEQFNKPMPFPEYLEPFLPETKEVDVLDVGAGPVCIIGKEHPTKDIEITAIDNNACEYHDELIWGKGYRTPLTFVYQMDMEELVYKDNAFDIVHCINALDHTPNLEKAVSEMKRVCKPGGYIYMRHGLGQKKRFGGHHYWNMEEVELPEFDTRIIDNGDYKKNFIEHIWRKI